MRMIKTGTKILLMILSLMVSVALIKAIPQYGNAVLSVITAIFCSLELCSKAVEVPLTLVKERV